jgi:hypothetical protein
MIINVSRDSLDITTFGDGQRKYILSPKRYRLTLERNETVVVSDHDFLKFEFETMDLIRHVRTSPDLPAGQVILIIGQESRIVFLPVI